ncbi:hypothetical protein GOEFS_081_00080 [Gordonia effusa NBRC 100432]|uniref:Low molecular weight antigen MTB12-like C-terminal domain-containing protein n=1 Tax=Gordonia effusa NBRC 100432 TaxID=1077974 RepID=H0R2L8_9ACTN|nr:hypothetical protein [Gordonia effusa]GAB19319.1 hypothetical protein GOEFS_081_00080 [Gordonia effusa NBRC 100432]
MTLRFAKFVAAAAVLGAAATLTACGTDDEAPIVPTAPSSSSAAESSTASADGITGVTDPNKRPTVAVLNKMLDKALDADAPASEKTLLVQGSEKDPQVFTKLDKALKDNPGVTYKIFPPVIPAGPKKANVKVQVKLPGEVPTKLEASIVFDDGRWKLANSTVCPLLSANNVKSAMCPTAAKPSK